MGKSGWNSTIRSVRPSENTRAHTFAQVCAHFLHGGGDPEHRNCSNNRAALVAFERDEAAFTADCEQHAAAVRISVF
jgi:hypothetical protein